MTNVPEIREVRVKASTPVNQLAGSLLAVYEKNNSQSIRLVAMGAGAVNQAVKGIICFNEFLAKRRAVATILPQFYVFIDPENISVTSIQLQLTITRL